MVYLFLLLAVLAAVHAACFGRWLLKNGNKPGSLIVFSFSFLCLALAAFRLVTAK